MFLETILDEQPVKSIVGYIKEENDFTMPKTWSVDRQNRRRLRRYVCSTWISIMVDGNPNNQVDKMIFSVGISQPSVRVTQCLLSGPNRPKWQGYKLYTGPQTMGVPSPRKVTAWHGSCSTECLIYQKQSASHSKKTRVEVPSKPSPSAWMLSGVSYRKCFSLWGWSSGNF